MTPAERYWLRIQRRAGTLTPDLAAALLRAWRRIGDYFTPQEIERLIAARDIEGVLARALSERNLEAAFAPVRERLQQQTGDAVRYFARDLPAAAQTIGIRMDLLNPRVLDAVRVLDDRVMQRLHEDVRATVRQHLTRGLEAGVGPRTIARGMRNVVALAPNQEAAIANFIRMLREGDPAALTRVLRDRRFDGTLRRAFSEGRGLSEEQITRMADAYRRHMVAFNAETQARTAALDSLKLGQRLAWEDAVQKGVIARENLRRTWKGVMDKRERETHRDMEGITVGFDEPWMVMVGKTLVAEMIPGDQEWNCRCIDITRAVA